MSVNFKAKTRVSRCAIIYEEGSPFNKEKAKKVLSKWRLKILKKHKKRFKFYRYDKNLDTWVDKPAWRSNDLFIQHATLGLSLFFKSRQY